ncbi:hypothetical protein GIB67_017739 [Kingdonia uniflora]|uniref:Pentatricopeptide repeat-containing protein n=1 Tax=Kingdonia uniflora TaxID=39325 RepID=A0A7J7LQ95_9MAGN|nr:hypothetical protein GIB67_017739 [Kingdonia uniflora]
MWNLLKEMSKRRIGSTPKTFAIVIEWFISAGKSDREVKTILAMHAPQDLCSLNTSLDLLYKFRRVEMAYGLLRCLGANFMLILQIWDFFLQMKKMGCEIDVLTYTTVIHGFVVIDKIDKAKMIFNEMIKQGCLPSVPTYNALIGFLCKNDNVENDIMDFEEMFKKGYARIMKYDEGELNVQMYNIVIRYFCDTGEIEKALEVFEMMCNGECLPNLDTYNVLISAMFVRKKVDDLLVVGSLLFEMVKEGFMP